MNTSTRFAVAVHILAALDFHDGTPVNSSDLATSVNTSAAVIRQLLMRLKDAGLVKSQMGPGGGTLLAKKPSGITLRDIWQATEDETIVCMHRNKPGNHCAVGRQILGVLEDVTSQAQQAMFEVLEQTTLEDVSEDIRARDVST